MSGSKTRGHDLPQGFPDFAGACPRTARSADPGAQSGLQLLKRQPLYDPVRDLAPILALAASSFCLPVHPSVPAGTLAEFVAYTNQNRGRLSYGHSGIGSLNHLLGERFKALAGIPELQAVPYRGAGVSLNDLVGGQVPMIVAALTAQVIELHRAGPSKRRRCPTT